MEIEFMANGSGGESELFVHLDLEGLAALLRAVESAMASGRGVLIPDALGSARTSPGRSIPGAFGKVTVTFDAAGGSGRGAESGAWSLPEREPAALQARGRQ